MDQAYMRNMERRSKFEREREGNLKNIAFETVEKCGT